MEEKIIQAPTQFGYDLLRDYILPDILGKHEREILYWSGKQVARRFPIFEIEELHQFFAEAGWGKLSLDKKSKDEAFYTLQAETETSFSRPRMFRLEAGFIAQQYEKLNGYLTECYDESFTKENLVRFHVKWDLKEKR